MSDFEMIFAEKERKYSIVHLVLGTFGLFIDTSVNKREEPLTKDPFGDFFEI